MAVFDLKTDGTTGRVREWAEACGCAEDVQIIGIGSTHSYNPFGMNVSVPHLESLQAKLATISPEGTYGHENAFWTLTSGQAIEAALALHLMAKGGLELCSTLKWLSDLLLTWKTPATECAWSQVKKIRGALQSIASQCSPISYLTMDCYCKNLESWNNLDQRTRGILITVVQHVIKPLLSPRMQKIFPSEVVLPSVSRMW
ncbi:MAG: hypothetical protein N2035_09995 [Chthoniobacterales bacterium]|nr:hypothetical protein [Chthoniobacterales bacterium]